MYDRDPVIKNKTFSLPFTFLGMYIFQVIQNTPFVGGIHPQIHGEVSGRKLFRIGFPRCKTWQLFCAFYDQGFLLHTHPILEKF